MIFTFHAGNSLVGVKGENISGVVVFRDEDKKSTVILTNLKDSVVPLPVTDSPSEAIARLVSINLVSMVDKEGDDVAIRADLIEGVVPAGSGSAIFAKGLGEPIIVGTHPSEIVESWRAKAHETQEGPLSNIVVVKGIR